MRGIALLFFLLITQVSWAQEICDNGIDDDNDNLVDLNDSDCECQASLTAQPSSLIPNASFEEHSCIPASFSDLDCADDWIQASDATSDYFHVNGFYPPGHNIPQPPLPTPDGDAFVGFYDNNDHINGVNTVYKEYVGACLFAPMEIGTSYTFQYFLAFSTPHGGVGVAPSIEVCVYGAENCANLPFEGINCPPEDFPNQWEVIDCVMVSGVNEWVLASQTFTPSKEYETVILGPNCVAVGGGEQYYYYLDNLVVNESALFGINQLNSPEFSCDGSFMLNANGVTSNNYQWYLDGVAITGETNQTLSLSTPQVGTYQVRVTDGGGCAVAQLTLSESDLSEPTFNVEINNPLCDPFGAQVTIQGDFDEIYLDGMELETSTVEMPAGDYIVNGIYWNNCSISSGITVPAIPGFDVTPDVQTILIGESTTSDITNDSDPSHSFSWSPAEGLSCINCQFPVFSPNETTTYTLTITEPENECSVESTVTIEVLATCILSFPTAFSPNGDGLNESLKVMGNGLCESLIFTAMVFDRWGNLIVERKGLAPGDEIWDGSSNGLEQPVGTYAVYLHYIDSGNSISVGGNLTLIR